MDLALDQENLLGDDNDDQQAAAEVQQDQCDHDLQNQPSTSQQYEIFRNQLISLMKNDRSLIDLISPSLIQSFTADSIQVHCQFIEKNFHLTGQQSKKMVDFLTQWLTLYDANEKDSFERSANPSCWRLAHVCTLFEYELNDILSLYSACCITDRLDPNQSLQATLMNEEQGSQSRSKVREQLFLSMFHHLWSRLCHDAENENIEYREWLESYDLITKYFPSGRVLGRVASVKMKDKIEFMDLSYLILLNERTPKPMALIHKLLQVTQLIQNDTQGQSSVCLQNLSSIIESIFTHVHEEPDSKLTLMIDIQQWIIRTLKSSKKAANTQVIALFKFLNQPNNHLSLSVKQFLFDELCGILIENFIALEKKQITWFWDHICLLPTVVNCVGDIDLEQYKIPSHPFEITDPKQNHLLIDLYFFYLRRLSLQTCIQAKLMQTLMLSQLPPGVEQQQLNSARNIFTQLKDYFFIQMTALVFCQIDSDLGNQEPLKEIVQKVIEAYLTIDLESERLNANLEMFLGAIVSRKTWNYLPDLLKSEYVQSVNSEWANKLLSLFKLDQAVQDTLVPIPCHRVQFTIGIDTTSSIFPNLHEPYQQLNRCIAQCLDNNDENQRWEPFVRWMQSKLDSNPPSLTLMEIKVMLLLNIYYHYYCTNRLESLGGLLSQIETHLKPTVELNIFRAFLQPQQFMIGYPSQNDAEGKNLLNDLFAVDLQNSDELPIRHVLVNLLAMILLAGEESFLWPFVFEPLKIQNTYGRAVIVLEDSHYFL